jgi:cobalt-zinc-cadmium resistance protein CzcA
MKAAELRSRSGETNRLEMVTARSQSMEISNQYFQVTADLKILSKKLAVLLNSSVPVVPQDDVLKKIEFIESPDKPVEKNPSLGYAEQQAEISGLEKKLERSRMLPDLSDGFFSQTITGTQEVHGVARNFGTDYRFTGIQAGISVPLWIAPFAARSKAAKINEEAARANAENYRKNLSGNYETLLDEFRKYSSAIDYYEKQAVPEANIIIDQANKSYKAGALDYLDYVLMLNRALDIRKNYIEALNDYNQTIISIEYITGKIL